jgi:O-antigen ligase
MRPDASDNGIDRLAYFAVCVSVLAITWNGLRFGGGAVANAFLVPAFAMAAVRTVVLRKPVLVPPWMLAAGIGFVLAFLLNLIFPPDSSLMNDILVHYRTIPQIGQPLVLVDRSDLLALIQFEIGLIVIPVLIASVATTTRRISRLLDVLVVSAGVNAFVGLIDWAGFHISPIQVGAGRTAGLTVHPNYLALTCTIAIPLALLWIGRAGRWRTAGFGMTGLLLAGAYVSGSRAGAVTAILGVLATMAVVPRLRPALGFTLPVAGMVLVAIAFFAGDQILHQVRLGNDVGTAVNTTGSDTQRSQLADLATHQFESRPVQGVGFNVIADAHDIYLQLLAAGGVIAMLSFLTYLGGLAASAWQARAGPQRDVAAAMSVAIVMWLINGTLDNQLGDKYLYVIPGLLIALAYVTAATRASEAPEPSPIGPETPAGRPLERVPTAA